MKIYLATPVNARKEKTIWAKMKAARRRILDMEVYLNKSFNDAKFCSSFDIYPTYCFLKNPDTPMILSESEIMGECVRMVMEADMIVLDDGWECSQGCTVERFVAMQYGKQVKTINSFKLAEQLKTK